MKLSPGGRSKAVIIAALNSFALRWPWILGHTSGSLLSHRREGDHVFDPSVAGPGIEGIGVVA